MEDPGARGEVTVLLGEIGAGDAAAADRLMPLVYAELRSLANGYLARERAGHTLQPTALVHEAYIKLVGGADGGARPGFSGHAHFLAAAAIAMRRLLTDHARRRNTEKRGGGWKRVTLDRAAAERSWADVDLVELDEVLDRLGALNERHAMIVQHRFFGGMTSEQTAEVLGVSLSTVERDWRAARAWLSAQLGERRPGDL